MPKSYKQLELIQIQQRLLVAIGILLTICTAQTIALVLG